MKSIKFKKKKNHSINNVRTLNLPRIESIAGLPFNHASHLLQFLYDLLNDFRAQHIAIVKEIVQGFLETVFIQFTSPVLVLLHIVIHIGLIHLHATQTYAQRTGSAGRTFGHLLRTFFGRRIVAMLSGAHFQI